MNEKPPDGHPSSVKPARPQEIEAVLGRIDAMQAAEFDLLPLGMIQLDLAGTILEFNKAEAELARINRNRQIGRNFFEEVAPCTKVKEFHGRFVEGVAKKELYATFGFVFKFAHGPRNVAITLFYAKATDSVWVLVSEAALP